MFVFHSEAELECIYKILGDTLVRFVYQPRTPAGLAYLQVFLRGELTVSVTLGELGD